MKEKGPLFISALTFLSIDLRKLGRSLDVGSNERRRRLNCCMRPRLRGGVPSWSTTVGAVVMIDGAAAYVSDSPCVVGAEGYGGGHALSTGTAGTGGGSSSTACSLALRESWESEAWRKRIKLKRRVMELWS
jgi:hypothetical protein